MEIFQLTLKNEKLRFYNRISWLIILIHIIVFFYLAIFGAGKFIKTSAIAELIMLAVVFGIEYYLRKKNRRLGFHVFFVILMVGWISMRVYWLAIVPIIFDLLYTFASRKFIAAFSPDGITYPSFPVKSIKWSALSNVILKAGLLTIDFKNNKLIQQMVDETSTVNEKDFNEFCKEQLRTTKTI